MRCSECARRNSPSTRFCLHCGLDMQPTSSPTNRVAMPPQEGFGRHLYGRTGQGSHWVSPIIISLIGAIVIVAGAYYWFIYRDSFKVLAVDYEILQSVDGK